LLNAILQIEKEKQMKKEFEEIVPDLSHLDIEYKKPKEIDVIAHRLKFIEKQLKSLTKEKQKLIERKAAIDFKNLKKSLNFNKIIEYESGDSISIGMITALCKDSVIVKACPVFSAINKRSKKIPQFKNLTINHSSIRKVL
jgi:hypothetical protein